MVPLVSSMSAAPSSPITYQPGLGAVRSNTTRWNVSASPTSGAAMASAWLASSAKAGASLSPA